MAVSTCCTCGHTWTTGKNGSYSCALVLSDKYDHVLSLVGTLLSSDGKEDEYHSIPYNLARNQLKMLVESHNAEKN